MTTATSCPTPEQIEDLQANRLSAAEASSLRQHLVSCPLCQSTRRIQATIASAPPLAYHFLSPPREPGELGWLDAYRIVGVLGEGGMSIVFEAVDTSLTRVVALKVLRPRMADPNMRERFLREARLIASLPHEHIVTIYQVGEANDVPYLTMERLEGGTLEDRLEHDQWLPLAEAISLAREAAEGLVAAHEHGLVHRDVKPANIWLETRNGRFHRVKLIDFGIARMVNQDQGLTAAGQILGTPMYMAPEQAAAKAVDGRSDIYSLGCVLYHMITGRPPFDGREPNTMALLSAVVKGDAPSVREVAPNLPRPVAELLHSMLERDPNKRPASARVLVERLRRLEGGACEVVAPPPTNAQTRGLMRRPGVIGICVGIVTILAALLVGVYFGWHKLFPHPAPLDAGSGDQGDGTPSGAPLRVGVLHSQTGYVSVHEKPITQATQLAIDEINRTGGVLGRPLEVYSEDGASDEEVFAKKATKLIVEDKVEVLFGCWTSSARKRVAEVCQKHDRLLFFPTSYEGLESEAHVVYLGGTPNQYVIPFVHWAYTAKGKRKFFLIGSEDVYSRSIAAILSDEIKKLGGTLVGERFAALGETNFDDVVREIKAKKPDMILNALDGHDNLALLLKLRREKIGPPDVPTLWLSVSESELGQFNIPDMVGDYTAACYFESLRRKANQAFVERFRKRFGQAERVSDTMQTAYFGVSLWKKAVEKAGSTGTEAVRKALGGLSVEAPEGEIRLTKTTQHAYRTALVGEIRQGKDRPEFRIVFTTPEPIEPEIFPPTRSEPQWRKFQQALFVEWGNKWERHR